MKKKQYSFEFNGDTITAEFSDLAEQANGSVIMKYGDTIVMANTVMSNSTRDNLDYFPLTVDYEEKFYAAGKILGGRFVRREGRPSEEAILNGRMIDRTLRPLFDHRMRNETQVVATVLSIDEKNDPDVLAIVASSLALAASDIPWNGPIGAVRVGYVEGNFVINPTTEQKQKSEMEIIVCGKDGKINMIEGKVKQVPEEIVVKGLEAAVPAIEKLVEWQEKIIKDIGKEKYKPEFQEAPEAMIEMFQKHTKERVRDAIFEIPEKNDRNSILGNLKGEWMETCIKEFPETPTSVSSDVFENSLNEIIHDGILNGNKRSDGRKNDELRPLFADVKILPRAHGSGVFYRGQTHILSVATLGSPGDVLIIEGMEVREKKKFIHHYNFPPFSTGETGRMGSPGRREIGHGALAEKALMAIIPEPEEFPYAIRLVSETMSSNGSSSMGSVCASCMALMDAGVPIKAPVAGIAMGIMIEDDNKYKVLTDIQGPEDHHGDTDFKAAGTEKGVTAIQMDVKVNGLTIKMLADLLAQARKARMEILQTMLKVLDKPRAEMSPYAPKIITIEINPEKIRDVVGPGGKTINKIIELTGANIDIEQTGQIFITGKTQEEAEKAKEMISDITYEPKPGERFNGTITRIFDFGVMAEIKPGLEGLIHISEMAGFRVNKVTDFVNPGDTVPVVIKEIDEMGRINLSIKQADPNFIKKPEGYQANNGFFSGNGSGGDRPRRNNDNDRGGRRGFGDRRPRR